MPRKRKPRTYDATSRQQSAEHTRASILDHALRLFLRDGYASTTIAAIAKAAEVSAETIYKAFGGKPGVVRALRDRALAGAGPVHAEQRSDAMQARETDPRVIFKAWTRLSAEVAPRVSPILLLVRDAAAHDPELAKLQDEMDASRLERMAQNARTLTKFGIDAARARDLLWTATSPELYELLVLKRGWSVDRYALFLEQLLVTCLAT
jgi:AcrR family transcriptional regulator